MSEKTFTSRTVRTILASEMGARLDSNVHTGGGTDDTAALQAALDLAKGCGGVHLVMDGAALITGLRLYSNTTIECLNADCGFFLADGANTSLLHNAHLDYETIHERNISIIGGTYNHNCRGQLHHVPVSSGIPFDVPEDSAVPTDEGENIRWVIGFEFYGVEGLTIRDVTIQDQRTFAMLIANWRHVTVENVRIELPNHKDCENQDGIHFWGPGQFLTMRDIRGRSGDDFIALAPDERDKVSSITDVLIDGVMLDEADQGIRLLSRGSGRLDRVTIRNVTGTYKSFGFFINPWFPDVTAGAYGSIVIENVDLRPMQPNYTYRDAFLFQVGGHIESLTLRNIVSHCPCDDRPLFELSTPFYDLECDKAHTRIGSLLIDGLQLYNHACGRPPIRLECEIGRFTLRDADVYSDGAHPIGALIRAGKGCNVKRLALVNVHSVATDCLLDAAEGRIGSLILQGVVCDEGDTLREGGCAIDRM